MKPIFEKYNKMQNDFILKSIIPKGFIAGMRLNGFAVNCQYDVKPLNIHNLIIPSEFGGIINLESTFQVDCDILTDYVKSLLINKFYNTLPKREMHRWFAQPVKTRTITFSIGNYIKGCYKSDDGLTYNKTSISIEVRGITSVELVEIAMEICKNYKQSSVLIEDKENHNLFTIQKINQTEN